MDELKWLATGVGHCGTTYVADFLSYHGVPCSHERIFQFKVEETPNTAIPHPYWYNGKEVGAPRGVVAEASYRAAAHLNHPYIRNAGIIHVVRDPLKVLRSWLNSGHDPTGLKWQGVVVPGLRKYEYQYDYKLAAILSKQGAMYLYAQWTSLIDQGASRYGRRVEVMRIEDSPSRLMAICGIETEVKWDDANAGKKTTSSTPELTWGDLPECPEKERLIECAQRFGYL